MAGHGGHGVVAWRREKFLPKGGPNGGNGGMGGSVRISADENLFSLDHLRNKRLLSAENGACGGSNNRQGRKGEDLLLKVPCGTLLRDPETGEILYDLKERGEEILLCQGGKGGLGNAFFKTPTNRAPTRCTPGKEGEVKEILLELKLIADVGLVGLPNAGKSSLLSKISHAKVKIGNYPFTTLTPNISVLEFDDFSRLTLADIPGIIEKAHENKGLGLSFLRHIERAGTLIYVIDLSSESPLDDFKTLREEIRAYSEETYQKPFLVALSKTDLDENTAKEEEFRNTSYLDPSLLCPVSTITGEGLSSFVEKMRHLAQRGHLLYK